MIRRITSYLVFYVQKKLNQKLLFRVIKLENGLIACLISDTSPPASEENELSEDEGSYEETSSADETGESGSSDDEEVPGHTEQKMVRTYVCLLTHYFE